MIKMGVGEDVGPTPSQTEEMRSRLKSHIAENGMGESLKLFVNNESTNSFSKELDKVCSEHFLYI